MKILIAVDGSDPAQRAAEWAVGYAKATGATVIAADVLEQPVYAVPPMVAVELGPLPPEVKDEVAETLKTEWCKRFVDAGVEYEAVVLDGPVAGALRHLADERDVDLVVVGRRGRGGFAELLLGSVSNQLAHHIGRPLVIVP